MKAHSLLVVFLAAVQAVAPVLCCCLGTRAVAAVYSATSSGPAGAVKKSCCPAEPVVAHVTKPSCCPEKSTPAKPAPTSPCECCAKAAPVDPALPEVAVVPDTSNQVLYVGSFDVSLNGTGLNLSVLATAADPPPEFLSPRHVRIHAHHAMRC